jgi:hypothetical protein
VALARIVAVSAVALALASTLDGARVVLPRLNDAHAYWAVLDPSLRDDPVAELYGFGEEVWQRLRRSVGRGDRYAVVAEGDGQHEIRNYAAYTLLPAIQVRDPARANVVVYYQVGAPATGCERIAERVCIVRRES